MSRVQAILEGRTGGAEFRYRLYRSNVSGQKLEELPGVEGASVTLSNYRDHTWELSLPMRATTRLDVFRDYVKLVIELRDGEGWLRYPFGLYYFDAPKGRDDRLTTGWSLVGRSPEATLLTDSAHQTYTVLAGTGVLARVRQILLDRGVPADRIAFPTTDKALTSPATFDPLQDAEGSKWLRICNALLAAGGFYALYADNEGRLTTKEIEDLPDKEAGVAYGTEEGTERLIGDSSGDAWVDFEYDDERFANRVVVYSSDPNQSPTITAVAELHAYQPASPPPGVIVLVDPDSRVSVEALGRVVQKEPVVLQNLISQAEANRLALANLRLASSMDLKLAFPTVPDPRRVPRETYALDVRRDGERLYGETWPVTGFTLPLDLKEMVHEVSRQVRV